MMAVYILTLLFLCTHMQGFGATERSSSPGEENKDITRPRLGLFNCWKEISLFSRRPCQLNLVPSRSSNLVPDKRLNLLLPVTFIQMLVFSWSVDALLNHRSIFVQSFTQLINPPPPPPPPQRVSQRARWRVRGS